MERIFLHEAELPRVDFTEDVVSGAVIRHIGKERSH